MSKNNAQQTCHDTRSLPCSTAAAQGSFTLWIRADYSSPTTTMTDGWSTLAASEPASQSRSCGVSTRSSSLSKSPRCRSTCRPRGLHDLVLGSSSLVFIGFGRNWSARSGFLAGQRTACCGRSPMKGCERTSLQGRCGVSVRPRHQRAVHELLHTRHARSGRMQQQPKGARRNEAYQGGE